MHLLLTLGCFAAEYDAEATEYALTKGSSPADMVALEVRPFFECSPFPSRVSVCALRVGREETFFPQMIDADSTKAG